MESELLPYPQSLSIIRMHLDLNKNHVKLEVFLKECGLISISEKDIFHFILKEVPFLKLIDKQKWFLAKIKYGI